ncbi:uncharacterized protein LOC130561141 [Triplophysa rosa]|uniref:uncharacterized protein LOC130561141 n=1 Tax=Triplophysa rosa TaxID=992332 RepID=UPI0025461A73|nr:uncharacterized protein LOC130561141 [Triplophysa rosa]
MRYSRLSDSQLDEIVQHLVGENDEIGANAVRARLAAVGVRVQRMRVRDSMVRVNPTGAAQRALAQKLHRRIYRVAGPNSLWHIDGNHKLIRWRIVIHGGICGFSRLVVFLWASDNNRSSTVFEQFVHSTSKYGVPSRVRCGHGGENNDVCLFMNTYRGWERGSAIRGKSVHNQRIERLWGDLWRGVTHVYHQQFSFLESERIINCSNELQMWALHYVYLPQINRDIEVFVDQWNNHGLRTVGHQTPYQLFVQGYLQRQAQPLTAMAEVFETNTAPQGAVASVPVLNRQEVVSVPVNQFSPSQIQMQQFQEVDILGGPMNGEAIDALQTVIRILQE